jgi:hypothetical protein
VVIIVGTAFFICCSDVPPDVLTFTVTVYNKGKRSKDTEVAELTVELSSLTNGDEVRLQRLLVNGENKNSGRIILSHYAEILIHFMHMYL